MASPMRWHKRFSSDVIKATRGIGADAIGAYNMIIDQIYANGGPIERSDKMLAALLGETDGKAKKLTNRLIEIGLITVNETGQICNEISENQMETYGKLVENRKISGKKGGENKKLFSQKTGVTSNENNTLSVALATKNSSNCLSKNVADKDKDKDKEISTSQPLEIYPARDANLKFGIDDDFQNYFDQVTDILCNIGHNGNFRIPQAMMQTNTAWAVMVRQWYDSGARDAIIQALPECRDMAGGPIKSPNFFTRYAKNPVANILEYQEQKRKFDEMDAKILAEIQKEEQERNERRQRLKNK